MNEQSSRSHTIFRLVVESRLTEEKRLVLANGDGEAHLSFGVKYGVLNLVDLAGSERL